MDLDHLRTFRAIARSGSFTAAAESLHYAQSTVSVHIRALEAELGAPLFDRLPAGARLTDVGRRLIPLAERMLDLAAAAATVAGHDGEAVGELTIAAPETVVAHHLPAVLHHLRDRHPQVRVRLEPVPYHEIRSAVATGLVAGVRPGHTLEFDSVEAIRRCVEAGLGVALLPQAWVAAALRSGAVVAMDWFAPRFEAAIQLAWHPARWQGPALRAIIAASEACIGPRLATAITGGTAS